MNKDAEAICEIRGYTEDDKAFIMQTFLLGLWYGDTWFSQIPKDIFMLNYKKIIEALLKRSTVNVACLKEDPSVILGYSILSPDYSTIHWVHIKKAFRGNGIARSLVPERPAYVSHLSKAGKAILTKLEHCVFNPWAL